MQRNGRYKQAHLLSDAPVLDSTISVSNDVPIWKTFSGFQILVLVSSVFQMMTGVLCVGLALLSLISPLWLATLISMLGSIITMVGAYVFYETVKNRNNVEKLSREAINRVISEQN